MTKAEILEWLIKIAESARWSIQTGEEHYLYRLEQELSELLKDEQK